MASGSVGPCRDGRDPRYGRQGSAGPFPRRAASWSGRPAVPGPPFRPAGGRGRVSSRPLRPGTPSRRTTDAHKTEGLRGRTFATRAGTNLALFEYIDGFCNSRRAHELLGHLGPVGLGGQVLRRAGCGRTSAPETPSTRSGRMISPFQATGEPHGVSSDSHRTFAGREADAPRPAACTAAPRGSLQLALKVLDAGEAGLRSPAPGQGTAGR